MEEQELINLAKEYFPIGISDSDPEYQSTTQYLNLMKAFQKRDSYHKTLICFAKSIRKKFPFCEFIDLTKILKNDRCVKGKFIIQDKGVSYSFMVYISFCAPYYACYETIEDYRPKSFLDFFSHRHVLHQPREAAVPFFEYILIELPKYFSAFKRMKANHINITIDNIMYDGIGRLAIFSNSSVTQPMTLFNVFFSNNYF